MTAKPFDPETDMTSVGALHVRCTDPNGVACVNEVEKFEYRKVQPNGEWGPWCPLSEIATGHDAPKPAKGHKP